MTYHVRIYSTTGEFLLQTWNKGEHSRDMEIECALQREDVGRVEWWGDGPNGTSLTTVYPKNRRAPASDKEGS